MSAEVIESYLVALGFEANQPQLVKFQGALKTAGQSVTATTSGAVADFLKFQIGVTTAFTAAGFGVIGFIDKLAMGDQQMRLFAQRSFMTIQQARSVQTALNTLGVSLEDVAWDRELHQRFVTLIQDQRELSAMIGPQYEKQMEDVRDVWFQLQRLEVKGEYFGMKFASDLLKKLGFGDGDLLKALSQLNDFVLKNMPMWSDELSTDIMPILRDFWGIMKDLGQLGADVGLEFTNLVGVLSGDNSIEGATFDFHKFAEAVGKVAHWMAVVVHYMVRIEEFLVRFGPLLGGILGGGSAGGAIGAIVGGVAGIPGGPAAMLAGAAAGGATGSEIGAWLGGGTGAVVTGVEEYKRYSAGGAGSPGVSAYDGVAPADLIRAIIKTESDGRQNDANGNTLTSSAGAMGLMQVLQSTADRYHMDPRDPKQNVAIGTKEINRLLSKYGGNPDNAIAAYNWGEGNVDSYLKTGHGIMTRRNPRGVIPQETRDYVRKVEAAAGISIGTINIPITQPNASPQQIQSAVTAGVKSSLAERDRRLMAESGGAYQ
jgi:hypothetical protein